MKDPQGNSMLHLAAELGHNEIISFLMHNGLDVALQNNSGHTPLHLAVSKGHHKTVELLPKKGADPTIEDNSGVS